VTLYYRIDGRRITLREYRRLCPNVLVFLLAAGLKLLGGGIRFTGLVPRIDRLHEITWDDVPADLRGGLSGPVAELERVGFRQLFLHRVPTPQRSRAGVCGVLLAPTGDAYAKVASVIRPDGRRQWVAVVARLTDGGLGATTDDRLELDDPPFYRRVAAVGARPVEVWDRHREAVLGWSAGGVFPLPLTPEAVRTAELEMESGFVDFHAARGVLVPVLDEDELDELAAREE
jgi:hypothetical protein